MYAVAFALHLRADHETGNVLQIQQRQAAPLGGLDEVRHLSRRFRVHYAADAWTRRRLQKPAPIRDDADRLAVEMRVCAQQLRRVRGLKSAAVRELLPRASEEAVHRDYFVLA